MKQVLKVILRALAMLVVIFILFLVWSTATDFRPDLITGVESNDTGEPTTFIDSGGFTALIWNIGYCGLDRGMDFFYDGGSQVRPYEDGVDNNLRAVKIFIQRNYRDLDFILLQEVDRDSKRSYNKDLFSAIAEDLPGWNTAFAINYKAGFVPLPPTNPMGKVLSGLATFSRHTPDSMARYDFPGSYAWPTRLFMLDRCFLLQRYRVENGKELILVNTHNSAYDDGTLKAAEMELLKEFVLEEYSKGNYVLAGGDWNQCPPEFMPGYDDQPFDTLTLTYIGSDFLPDGWTWGFDARTPTNRRVQTAYEPGETLTTVIDFFLASPNVELTEVRGINLMFEFSDHNPVIARFRLK